MACTLPIRTWHQMISNAASPSLCNCFHSILKSAFTSTHHKLARLRHMHVWDPDRDHLSEQESHYTLEGTLAVPSVYLIVCMVSPSCSRNWPGSSNGWWRTGSRPQSLVRRRRRLGHVVCAELVNEATFLHISHTLVCQFTCLLVADSCSYQPLAINGY